MNSTVWMQIAQEQSLFLFLLTSSQAIHKTEHQPERKQPPRTHWVFTLTLSSTTLWLLWPLSLWHLLHLLQHCLCSYETKSHCWTKATEHFRSLWEYCSKRFVVPCDRYESNIITFHFWRGLWHEEFHWGDQIWVCAGDGGCDCFVNDTFELLVE